MASAEGKIFSKGPHGEKPAPPSSADLTPDEVARVKAKGATAAIVMHYAGNDWAIAQIDGLKNEFGRLGIQVVAGHDVFVWASGILDSLEHHRVAVAC